MLGTVPYANFWVAYSYWVTLSFILVICCCVTIQYNYNKWTVTQRRRRDTASSSLCLYSLPLNHSPPSSAVTWWNGLLVDSPISNRYEADLLLELKPGYPTEVVVIINRDTQLTVWRCWPIDLAVIAETRVNTVGCMYGLLYLQSCGLAYIRFAWTLEPARLNRPI